MLDLISYLYMTDFDTERSATFTVKLDECSGVYSLNINTDTNNHWHQAWRMPIKVNEKPLTAEGGGLFEIQYLSSSETATTLV